MAVTTVRPNADGTTLQFIPDTGSVHYDRVNDAATQPTAPTFPGGNLSMGTASLKTEELHLERYTGAGQITQVKVWTYASFSGMGGTFQAQVYIGGAWQTAASFSISSTAAAWRSVTFTGTWANASDADYTNLQVRLTYNSPSPTGTLGAVQVEVTSANTGTFDGVAGGGGGGGVTMDGAMFLGLIF